METIGTSCYTSNFNYVGYSPFSTSTSCTNYNVNDENYDIKPFDQYPYVVGAANGVVSSDFFLTIFYFSKHTVMIMWRYLLSS